MKTESQIQRRLRQRHFRVQKRVLEGSLRRFHRNCAHNVEAVTAYEGIACVCKHPDLTEDGSYDVEVGRLKLSNRVPRFPACDGDQDRSSDCPHFEPRHSKEILQERYKQLMSEVVADPEKFAEGFPDMAQLAWVLEMTVNGDSHTELPPPLEPDPEPEPADRVTDGEAPSGENPAANSAKSAATEEKAETTPLPIPEEFPPEPELKPSKITETAAPEGVATLTRLEAREYDLKSSWWRRLIGWILERWG